MRSQVFAINRTVCLIFNAGSVSDLTELQIQKTLHIISLYRTWTWCCLA